MWVCACFSPVYVGSSILHAAMMALPGIAYSKNRRYDQLWSKCNMCRDDFEKLHISSDRDVVFTAIPGITCSRHTSWADCLHYLRRAVFLFFSVQFLFFSAHDFPWVSRGKLWTFVLARCHRKMTERSIRWCESSERRDHSGWCDHCGRCDQSEKNCIGISNTMRAPVSGRKTSSGFLPAFSHLHFQNHTNTLPRHQTITCTVWCI